MRVISVANHKGGCGKTTTAINLAASLAFLQKKILLIDLDPQGHSTCGLGVKAEVLEKTAYDLLRADNPPSSISDIVVSVDTYLDLIPSHIVLSVIEQELAGIENRENKLLAKLHSLPAKYDFVLIDCPPSLGILTFNALRAADEIIIPIEPSFFSLHGLGKIFETIETLRESAGKTLRIHALLTRYDSRARLAREIKEEVRQYFQDRLLLNPIRENIRLREAAAAGKSIVDFDRQATGFKDYMNLAIEVIERGMCAFPAVSAQVASPEPIHPESQASFQEESPLESAAQTASILAQTGPAVIEDRNGAPVSQEMIPAVLTMPHPVLGGTLFSYHNPAAREVLIAGDFNHWVAEGMTKVEGELSVWQKIVPLNTGTYHYKFLVDGEWRMDPSNSEWENTPYGGINSIIHVE